MVTPKGNSQAGAGGGGQMPATLWTVVVSARDIQSPDSQAALARLCESYRLPLYIFVRSKGNDHHQAEDLTQGFFESLFEKDWLRGVDQKKGRFRTFLLCALTNFLSNEREKEQTIKRGGTQQFVSWDAAEADAQYDAGPVSEVNAVLDYERQWACTLVEKALDVVKDEYARCRKQELFDILLPFLTRPVPTGFYDREAPQLHMTSGALKVAMHRLVLHIGEQLRHEVANTVADRTMVDTELREVIKAWAGD